MSIVSSASLSSTPGKYVNATVAPSSAKWWPTARPIPESPPVINATRPCIPHTFLHQSKFVKVFISRSCRILILTMPSLENVSSCSSRTYCPCSYPRKIHGAPTSSITLLQTQKPKTTFNIWHLAFTYRNFSPDWETCTEVTKHPMVKCSIKDWCGHIKLVTTLLSSFQPHILAQEEHSLYIISFEEEP